jgi:hypothetical protein
MMKIEAYACSLDRLVYAENETSTDLSWYPQRHGFQEKCPNVKLMLRVFFGRCPVSWHLAFTR